MQISKAVAVCKDFSPLKLLLKIILNNINIMKKIQNKLWILGFFISFSVFGQTTITGLKKDYTESMDSLLLYVNKQPITTGILHERVMNFSNLDALKANGAITNSNYNHFLQSWSEFALFF